jgi:hypothetical protein
LPTLVIFLPGVDEAGLEDNVFGLSEKNALNLLAKKSLDLLNQSACHLQVELVDLVLWSPPLRFHPLS